jgi:hypothetical protein
MARSVALAALVAAATAVAWAGSQPDVVTVYVFAGDPTSGFVSPDARDSARDLTGALAGKRVVRVVTEREKADIWVRIDRRYLRPSGSAIATGNSTMVAASQVEEQVVCATLIIGQYATPIEGIDWWSWKSAAGKLAKNIDRWVKENGEQIRARRTSKDAK